MPSTREVQTKISCAQWRPITRKFPKSDERNATVALWCQNVMWVSYHARWKSCTCCCTNPSAVHNDCRGAVPFLNAVLQSHATHVCYVILSCRRDGRAEIRVPHMLRELTFRQEFEHHSSKYVTYTSFNYDWHILSGARLCNRCEDCDARFVQNTQLKMHIKSQHSSQKKHKAPKQSR